MKATRRGLPSIAATTLVLLLSAAAREASALDDAEFSRLHALLKPGEEAWRHLPWEPSILEARERAAREGKPIYMLVRSGHPLGCV